MDGRQFVPLTAGKVVPFRCEPVNSELRLSHSDDREREESQKHEHCYR
jgi:hypothetical protein